MVPLCNLHHRAIHDCGDEKTWWKAHGVDAIAEAERLWRGRSSSLSPTEPAQQESVEPARLAVSPAPSELPLNVGAK